MYKDKKLEAVDDFIKNVLPIYLLDVDPGSVRMALYGMVVSSFEKGFDAGYESGVMDTQEAADVFQEDLKEDLK
jgi:hypothetical protein